jgi:hypothetical protein
MPTEGHLRRHASQLSPVCEKCPFSISRSSVFISISIKFFICIAMLYKTLFKITLNAKVTVIEMHRKHILKVDF